MSKKALGIIIIIIVVGLYFIASPDQDRKIAETDTRIWKVEGDAGLLIGGYGDNFVYNGENVRDVIGNYTLDVDSESNRGKVEVILPNATYQTSEHITLQGKIKLVLTFNEGDTHTHAENLEGIHIMPDGSVMLGDGTVVEDAQITDSGKIKLSDGRIIEPAMDLRESNENDSMKGMGMDHDNSMDSIDNTMNSEEMNHTHNELEPYKQGGVAELIYMHGDTNQGAPVMPKVWTYLAGWGDLDIFVNDELIYDNLMGHFMITEQARRNKRIVDENGVPYNPTRSAESGFTNPDGIEFHIVAHSMDPDENNFPPHTDWIHLNFQNVNFIETPEDISLSVPR